MCRISSFVRCGFLDLLSFLKTILGLYVLKCSTKTSPKRILSLKLALLETLFLRCFLYLSKAKMGVSSDENKTVVSSLVLTSACSRWFTKNVNKQGDTAAMYRLATGNNLSFLSTNKFIVLTLFLFYTFYILCFTCIFYIS